MNTRLQRGAQFRNGAVARMDCSGSVADLIDFSDGNGIAGGA